MVPFEQRRARNTTRLKVIHDLIYFISMNLNMDSKGYINQLRRGFETKIPSRSHHRRSESRYKDSYYCHPTATQERDDQSIKAGSKFDGSKHHKFEIFTLGNLNYFVGDDFR